jgi:predicted nucleic acid-binding protein
MFLLDTNVVSELRKARAGKADSNVAAWAARVPADSLFVSVITIQELEIGVLRAERRDVSHGSLLRRWLEEHMLPAFAQRIIAIDTTIACRSAVLHIPDPRPVRDALIAASALVYGMSVVTRNLADFAPTGAKVINPWESGDATA